MKSDCFQNAASSLLAWYGRHSRDLPWRKGRDPYAIWVCEVMLQQTQVAVIRERFGQFMQKFPDVRGLAGSSLDSVLKAWEGLGYYARARNLHKAAKIIVSQHAGKLPEDPQTLLGLPGVGRYTAGAIASIAFGLDEPVLDGNVKRVLCRVFCIRQNPKEGKTERRLWSLARQLVPSGKAGLFNQALMDLGALVCVPGNPRCELCPLAKLCGACARGEQNELPRKGIGKAIPHHDVAAGVIWKSGRILVDQRKPDGLLGGLWEFPGGKRKKGESLKACLVREVREEIGIVVKPLALITSVEHAYTHFRITLYAFECDYVSGRARAIGCAAVRWIRPKELDRFAFPAANKKIIAELRARRCMTRTNKNLGI